MKAGSLEIEILANLARLNKDMGDAKATVTGAVRGINQVLGTIGVGLTFTGIFSLINKQIDMLDNLRDLSITTKISVEDLSGLSLVAQQTGTDVDTLAKSILMLQKNIGKSPEEFRKLGISAKDGVGQFLQMSDLFNSLEDDGQRVALMATAMGKSWQATAPALAEGSVKLAEQIEKGRELSGVTKENADRADEFNDRVAELKTGFVGFITEAVGPILPMLVELVKYMQQTGEKAEGSVSGLSAMQVILQTIAIAGANVGFVLKVIGMAVPEIMGKIERLAHGDLKGAMAIGDLFNAEIAKMRKELDKFENDLMNPPQFKPKNTAPVTEYSAEAAARAAAFLKTNTEAEKAAAAEKKKIYEEQLGFHKQQMEDLASLTIELQKANEAEKSGSEILQDKLDAYTSMTPALREYNQQLIDQVKHQEASKKIMDAVQENLKVEREEAQENARAFDAKVAMDEQLIRENEDLNAELIRNDKARALAQNQLEYQRALDSIAMLKATLEEKEVLEAQAAANNELRIKKIQDATNEMDEFGKNAAKGIQRSFADFLFDPFENGMNGMLKGFIDTLRRMVAEALAAKLARALFGEMGGGEGDGVFGGIFKAIGGAVLGGSTDLPDFVPSGNYASGTNYVPRDMLAQIHKGERIIPAGQNDAANTGNTTIHIQVDATGSKVEGDNQKGRELGLFITQAVQKELIKQKGPGGIL